MYEITKNDLARGRRLKVGAVAAPMLLSLIPAIVTFLLLLLAGGSPPAAAVILFFGVIATIVGFLVGIGITGLLVHNYSKWSREMREKIAADGIRAEEVNWFRNELKSNEKRALKAVEARDPLLGDAYRETLASRLTATRIVRSSKRELLYAKKRQSKLKLLNSKNAETFQDEIKKDLEKISRINDEAKLMLIESESRLQMIEAAATRGGSMADSELALKKLSARTAELPLALESAKMAEEIRLELEKEELE